LQSAAPFIERAFRNTAVASSQMSYNYWELADLGNGMAALNKALEAQRRGAETFRILSERHPQDPLFARSVAISYNDIGHTLAKMKRVEEAAASLREALARFEKLSASDPLNIEARNDTAGAYGFIIELLAQSGKKQEALFY